MGLKTYQTKFPIAQKVPRAWFDFSDTSLMTQSSGVVSKVLNKSIYAQYSADQGTIVNRPSVGTNFIANKNVLTFAGGQSMLITNGADLITPNTTFVAVFKPSSVGGGNVIRKDAGGFPTGSVSLAYDRVNQFAQYLIRDSGGTPITLNSSALVDTVAIAVCDFRSNAANSIYVNNNTVSSANPGVQTSRNYIPSIGARNVAGAEGYYNGDICEIIIYGEILTDADRNELEEYLANKWGGFLV